MKIIIIILLFIAGSTLSSCKYEPIYSQKEMNFKISKIEIENKNKINLEIKDNLNIYKNIKSSNEIVLEIDSQKNITTISKDANGNPKKFEMKIIVSLNVLQNENLKEKIKFTENFKYNNISNKFNLKQYENNIQKNLLDQIFQKILIYLSTI